MISLITVSLNIAKKYEDALIRSIIKNTSLINEVIVVVSDEHPSKQEVWHLENKAGNKVKLLRVGNNSVQDLHIDDQHALGLHMGLAAASNDLIMFCDPDVILFNDMEKVYINLMSDYKLNVVGASYHSAHSLAQTYFPCVFNMLLKKSELPNSDFLKGIENYSEGLYLRNNSHLPRNKFPNPEGIINTASSLCLWAKEQNWNWYAFQTGDARLYTTKWGRGNIKLSKRLPEQPLLYHAISGTVFEVREEKNEIEKVWGIFENKCLETQI
jgi:hypothetical protein